MDSNLSNLGNSVICDNIKSNVLIFDNLSKLRILILLQLRIVKCSKLPKLSKSVILPKYFDIWLLVVVFK